MTLTRVDPQNQTLRVGVCKLRFDFTNFISRIMFLSTPCKRGANKTPNPK